TMAPGADLAIGESHADGTFFGPLGKSAGGAEVVVQGRAASPQYAPGRVDGTADLHARLILRDIDRVSRLQHQIGRTARLAQGPRQIHVDPTDVVLRADKPNSVRIRL